MSMVRDNSGYVSAAAGREFTSPGRPAYRRIVVKAGTNVLAGGRADGGLDADVMAGLADQISRLAAVDGIQTLLVTSGAIAAGRQALAERVAVPAIPDIPTRQVLAALGQSRLMGMYAGLFEQRGIVVSQVLLTIKDMAQRQSYLNIRNTLLSLLDLGILPIVNENDVVAADEIGEVFGDNDRLSSLIATLIDADLLVILSDVDGLYTADPKSDATATRIDTVDFVDDRVIAMAGQHRNAWARGGMPTKLDAAQAGDHVGDRHVHLPGPGSGRSGESRSGQAGGYVLPAGQQQAGGPETLDVELPGGQRLGRGCGGSGGGGGVAQEQREPAAGRRAQRGGQF